MRMWARILIVCSMALSAAAAPIDEPIGGADAHHIQLALRAIKMTPHDLSFKKDHVESELVMNKAREFLVNPLALSAFAAEVMVDLRSVSNLVTLSEAKGLLQPTRTTEILCFAQNDKLNRLQNDKLSGLPREAAHAVQTIYDAAAGIRPLLPHPHKPAFDAFAAATFRDDREEMNINAELLLRDEALELQDDELANALLGASDRFDRDALMTALRTVAAALDEAIADLRANQFTEKFLTETDTPHGKIIIGGIGRNVYTNEAFLIIDLGGDDIYENSAGGANGLADRPISIVIDLGGNDQYISRRSLSQGTGVFGIGILVDLDGDDVYEAKHLSQGAGFYGAGVLADYGGQDKFVADTFAQGAGMFGAGILWQRGGDSRYEARQMAQGFGGTQGAGLLLDESGNDVYKAGEKYPCPWLPGHFFSLSQGFGYGMRPFAGGGVGILADLRGNDRYRADVYGQGASYWYAVGLLLDAEGNDSYRAHQYCQGAGIHLSSGALIDWAGDDQYIAHAICQGGAHDFSVGILLDRGGNDSYAAVSTAQGSAINNSFALLLDKAGDDFYAGEDPRQSQAAGHDGGKREYGSIALLLDLGGKDVYSQGQTNNAVWLKPWYGAGLDLDGRASALPREAVPSPETGSSQPATGRLYNIDPVDPHHPVERLFRRATSDGKDAEAAWRELKDRAVEVLPYLLTRLDSPNVMMRVKVEELVDHLDTNSVPLLITDLETAKNDEVARLCCYFLARFDEKARAAIPAVLPLIERPKTRATAFYTLGHLRAREAFEPALVALRDEKESIRLRAAQVLGRLRDRKATPRLIAALDDELWTVRYAAQDALVAIGRENIAPLRRAYTKASRRAQPHIIEALAKLGDRRSITLAAGVYRNDDPLLRDAVTKSLKSAVAGQ